jgi:hypothetical protein
MSVHRLDGVTLERIDLPELAGSAGYFVAARPESIAGEPTRNFIDIHADDLFTPHCRVVNGAVIADGRGPASGVVFHGPYWYLPRGAYRITVRGKLDSELTLLVAEKFGYSVAEFVASPSTQSFDFIAPLDLTPFDVVGRARGAARFAIDSFRITRIG